MTLACKQQQQQQGRQGRDRGISSVDARRLHNRVRVKFLTGRMSHRVRYAK